MVLRVEAALGDRHMARGLDEPGELGVGHLVPVDPEAPTVTSCAARLRPLLVVAHGEAAARDPDHAGGAAAAIAAAIKPRRVAGASRA